MPDNLVAPPMSPTGEPGVVYLLHFVDQGGNSTRYHHAAHYIGWAWNLDKRLREHRNASAHSSPLLRAVLDAGLDFVIARTWENVDRNFERALKNRGSAVRICPICREEAEVA